MNSVFRSMRSKTFLVALVAVVAISTAFSAIDRSEPRSWSRADALMATGDLPLVELPTIDPLSYVDEDAKREQEGLPYRFAIPVSLQASPATHGLWEEAGEGLLVWRLKLESPSALSLNLGFGRFEMPEGGRLDLYTADGADRIRPFTAEDNVSHGELWTPVLEGTSLVVEVSLPAASRDALVLDLTQVGIGYRGFYKDGQTDSGSCNVDVVCSQGDGWRDEIPSVAVIQINGSLNCTGFMVNNTAQDQTPYFMTARHCGLNSSNASSLVAYWNYETSTCGGTPNGTLDEFNSGSFWRSSYSPSDFTLVELDSDPDPSFGVTFSGWDRSGSEASSSVAIHHPSVDEKRISFENDPTTTTNYLGTSVPGDGTHVRVADWDEGTTEGGSSGSPLYNQDHQVIGQLHGGYAACGNNSADWYGKFSISWTGGGTDSTRLSNWLDPGGSGNTSLGTLVPGTSTCSVNADCDDGIACNGAETCDIGFCQPGLSPCLPGTVCDEVADQCVAQMCNGGSPNGTCESPETCNDCSDCIGGTEEPGCGDGICQPSLGEDCNSCSSDCNGKTNGNPSRQFCCGDDVGCGDSRCTDGSFACDTTPTSTSYCCGDLVCEGPEDTSNCAVDCESGGNCQPLGATCGSDSDCCSNKCKGPSGGKTCK